MYREHLNVYWSQEEAESVLLHKPERIICKITILRRAKPFFLILILQVFLISLHLNSFPLPVQTWKLLKQMTNKKIVFSKQYWNLTTQMSMNFNGKGGKISSLQCLTISIYGFLHAQKVFASQIQVFLSKQISLRSLGKAGSKKKAQKANRQINNIIARYRKGKLICLQCQGSYHVQYQA